MFERRRKKRRWSRRRSRKRCRKRRSRNDECSVFNGIYLSHNCSHILENVVAMIDRLSPATTCKVMPAPPGSTKVVWLLFLRILRYSLTVSVSVALLGISVTFPVSSVVLSTTTSSEELSRPA